ncbi:MAG: phosphoethanolamine transferase [Candidatus Midichloriaceae bacterium]
MLKLKTSIPLAVFNLVISIFISLFLNLPLWNFLYNLATTSKFFSLNFLLVFFIILVCFIYFAISLFSFRYIHKLLLSFILICGSLAQYFMLKYGVIIDSSMIQNVFETDFKESFELLTYKMILMSVFFGITPSFIIYKINVKYPKKISDYLIFSLFSILALVILMGVIFAQYKTFVSVFRNHKDIIFRIIPNNYINGIYQNIILLFPEKNVKQISSEANKNQNWEHHRRKTIFVFVIGEAARANNFSLNGYIKETNPNLIKHDVINFSNFYSCGTTTAVSVPCIFSSLDKSNFSKSKFKNNDNLLKLIKKSGFNALWIDNNSGCKSACDDVETVEMESYIKSSSNREIYDEEMLSIFEKFIEKNNKGDLFIVLHQKGSHGPAYYKRIPESFDEFKPICKSVELQQCSSEEITNSYDNTILYTDYFLSKVITMLKENKDADTAMIYVSDHGQSLGENGIYLHGMPYLVAPKYQKHIPMIMWLSENFTKDFGIDKKCVSKYIDKELSHDNLFHSILDVLKIDTKAQKNNLSFFQNCKVK